MTHEKYKIEIDVLKKFYELYCIDKHEEQKNILIQLYYKDEKFSLELNLCSKCFEDINYSFNRLQGCPHEIKPRCRSCPSPCYEKTKWKETAESYEIFSYKTLSWKNQIKGYESF